MIEIKNCPGNLASGFTKYSPSCIKNLFDGINVSPFCDFNNEASSFEGHLGKYSISGVQEKLSGIIYNKKIILSPEGVQGKYIIKVIPGNKLLQYRDQIPANEHLTMQIAKQVFEIEVAENGLVFHEDGSLAYICKRFDIDKKENKIHIEDFYSLSNFDSKYDGTYIHLANILKKYVVAWKIEVTKLFKLIVFNYLFSNGDAHLKNFSLIQSPNGDYILSPAYDLLSTSIHINDGDFALNGGLIFEEDYSDVYLNKSHPCKKDFETFANIIGVIPKKRDSIIKMFSEENSLIESLIKRSFLSEKTKRIYYRMYKEKLNRFLR